MKKLLTLILALIMCVSVFAGCKKNGEENQAPTLEQAKDYLYNIVKDKNGKAIPKDYDVVGKIIINEVSFDVTWTSDNEKIVVKESSKANCWTIDLPDSNATELEYTLTATIKSSDGKTITVSIKPKLPVIDNTGVVTDPEEGVAYKIFFEQMNLGYTLYALNTTQDNNNKFINATLDPKEAADFYAEKVEGGFKLYTEIDGVKNYVHATATAKTDGQGFTKTIGFATESDTVFVYDAERYTYTVKIGDQIFGVGTYNAYETISISEITHFTKDKINVKDGQFPIAFMTSAHAETLDPDEKPVFNDPADGSTLTIAQAIELGKTRTKDQYTEGKYYVTGTITEVQNDTYGNIVISDGTNTILVYGTFDAKGEKKYGEMESKPVVGDTVTVYGIVGMYNAPQLKNAWITNVVPGEGGGEVTPPAPELELAVVAKPVAGTAYKFGMVQGRLNKTYYLAGGMDGFYMASTQSTASAIDVYLETTDGGYYLYCMVNGVKTYINMVVSDTHVNGAYEATASTVYTYDETNKTIVANVKVGDTTEAYWFGTRNDKDFTTVGPCAVRYEGFFCQFYGEPCEHTYTDEVTAPTCKAEGYTTHTCSKCGDSYVDAKTGTVEHNFIDGGKCEWCDATPEHVCVYTDTVTPPTCTEDGYTTHACAGCGKSYKDTEVKAPGHNYTNGVCGTCNAADPNYYAPMTIPEALKAELGKKVTLVGTVITIDEAWSTKFNNITVTIADENGNKIKLYRLATNVEQYDVLEVKGVIGEYDKINQIAQGATATITGKHTTHNYADATCTAPKTCKVCGATEGGNAEHSYQNGTCTVCGATEGVVTVTVSKTHNDIAGIAGVTAGQNTGVIAKKEIKLDDNITAVFEKGKSTSDPCIYTESIRLYQGGATLTIKAAEGRKIKTIKLTLATKSGGQGPITVTGGTASALKELVYTITVDENTSEVVITTAGTDKNNRLYIAAIEVIYE